MVSSHTCTAFTIWAVDLLNPWILAEISIAAPQSPLGLLPVDIQDLFMDYMSLIAVSFTYFSFSPNSNLPQNDSMKSEGSIMGMSCSFSFISLLNILNTFAILNMSTWIASEKSINRWGLFLILQAMYRQAAATICVSRPVVRTASLPCDANTAFVRDSNFFFLFCIFLFEAISW